MFAIPCDSYGYNSDRVRRRCRLHKLDDMLDVKSPRCERPGCAKQPCCGHLGAKARFCSGHKHNGMVNLKVTLVMERLHFRSSWRVGQLQNKFVKMIVDRRRRGCRKTYVSYLVFCCSVLPSRPRRSVCFVRISYSKVLRLPIKCVRFTLKACVRYMLRQAQCVFDRVLLCVSNIESHVHYVHTRPRPRCPHDFSILFCSLGYPTLV